jgi:hypothetical protein
MVGNVAMAVANIGGTTRRNVRMQDPNAVKIRVPYVMAVIGLVFVASLLWRANRIGGGKQRPPVGGLAALRKTESPTPAAEHDPFAHGNGKASFDDALAWLKAHPEFAGSATVCAEVYLEPDFSLRLSFSAAMVQECTKRVAKILHAGGGKPIAPTAAPSSTFRYMTFPIKQSDDKRAVTADKLAAHGKKMKDLAARTLLNDPADYSAKVEKILTELVDAKGKKLRGAQDSPAAADATVLSTAEKLVAGGIPEGAKLREHDAPCADSTTLILLTQAANYKPLQSNSDPVEQWRKLAACVGTIVAVDSQSVFLPVAETALKASRYTASRLRARALSHCDAFGPAERSNAPAAVLDLFQCPGGVRGQKPPIVKQHDDDGDDTTESAVATVSPMAAARTIVDCSLLPRNCWIVGASIKYGTKTGIYRAQTAVATGKGGAGSGDHAAVILKQFNLLQYRTFRGYRRLVDAGVEHPYVNFPGRTCFESALSDSVLQEQSFVKGVNLKNFVVQRARARAKGSRFDFLSRRERLEIALHIACIFRYLHEHKSGPFSYDDNHPEQYMIDESKGHLSATLIDVDTVQRAVGKPGARYDPILELNYKTHCRCFYCHGRSNCMFINTPEGYKACGQWTGAHGDKEDKANVAKGRQCTIQSDAWFIGQLFYFMATAEAPWDGLGLMDVVTKLTAEEVPTLPPDFPDVFFAGLVERLFKERLSPQEMVLLLSTECSAEGCGILHCPAPLVH